VLPLLKNLGLVSTSPDNYRPISNLSTVSKLLERLVLARLRPQLFTSVNFSQYQYVRLRTGHSTETALLEVLDGIYTTRQLTTSRSPSLSDLICPLCLTPSTARHSSSACCRSSA